MIPPLPTVSILIPCRNESRTISQVLEAFARQTYPVDRMEILVADGKSQDDTRDQIRQFAGTHPTVKLRLIDNPGLTPPAAMNAGLREAKGEIILRMDAHAIPAPDYVAQCVRILAETHCDSAGGIIDIQPGAPGILARAIALAVGNPFATGGVRYRVGGKTGEVDTIPFGAFPRAVFARVGFYNERLSANEDYEFNYRIRASGGRIMFSPDIRSQYIARTKIIPLFRQYYFYGRGKALMLSLHPRSLRMRQLIPAVFILSLAALCIGCMLFSPLAILLAAESAIYTAINVGFSLSESIRKKNPTLVLVLPWVFACIHFSWGIGFWIGLAGNLRYFPRNGVPGKS
jgi:succinoglycan biosynthesis protein ExoA